ncbi:DNA mismatch repair protein Mlh1 [Fusarium chlamydosporum]
MVGRYAVHCKGVGFTCKKAGEASTNLSIQAHATVIDRIRQIHGSAVANELLEFSVSEARWGFKAEGYTTNANYSVKKTTILLFINHRCVESTHIKKAVEQTYANFLPKNGHPFIYLSLEIDPARVDVNVHPTKREVHFLNEDEIIQSICGAIEAKLATVDTSRTFMTQTLLPGAKVTESTPQTESDGTPSRRTPASKKRRYSNDLVRTDTAERKITSMFARAGPSESTGSMDRVGDIIVAPEPLEYETVDRELVQCRLNSVKQLREEVREDIHLELTEIFVNHTFVGVVDDQPIQGGVKLYLIDYGRTCYEYFYQLGLTDFGNFGTIKFTPSLDLRELLRTAAETEKSLVASPDDDFDIEALVDRVADQLIERREMLLEYFSVEISPAGELISLPLLIKGYSPPLVKLPRFLLRLGPSVDWTEEKACFDSFLRELATFYVPEQLPTLPGDAESLREENISNEMRARRQHVRHAVEHVLFPAFKARLVATKSLMEEAVLEVANLKGLYRVFERC